MQQTSKAFSQQKTLIYARIAIGFVIASFLLYLCVFLTVLTDNPSSLVLLLANICLVGAVLPIFLMTLADIKRNLTVYKVLSARSPHPRFPSPVPTKKDFYFRVCWLFTSMFLLFIGALLLLIASIFLITVDDVPLFIMWLAAICLIGGFLMSVITQKKFYRHWY